MFNKGVGAYIRKKMISSQFLLLTSCNGVDSGHLTCMHPSCLTHATTNYTALQQGGSHLSRSGGHATLYFMSLRADRTHPTS